MDRWPVDNYYTVNCRKLEYGIRMIGAGIPYTIPQRIWIMMFRGFYYRCCEYRAAKDTVETI